MATNLYKYYSHTQLILESFCKKLDGRERTKANNIYDHWGESVSKYERSNRVSPFTSKFDGYLKGTYTLSPKEMAGYNLFKGNCNSCHLDGRSTTLSADQ